MLVLLFTLNIAQAQNNQNTNRPIVLMGYLTVFPEVLGHFSERPTNVINNINRQRLHGYSDWRLPTVEELQLICGNRQRFCLNFFGWRRSYINNLWNTTVRIGRGCWESWENCRAFSSLSGYVILVRTN